MKKVLLAMALVFVSTINILSAQSIDTPTQANTPTAMRDIQFWFCNDWLENTSRALNSAIKQWTPFKVCAVWTNNGGTDASMGVEIADVWLSRQWSKSCTLTNDFEKFVNPNDLKALKNFVIPAGGSTIREFEIVFPIWLEWKQSWCFTYTLLKEGSDSMVWVVIRSATWMDFFVGNLDNINNEFEAKNIVTSIDWNKDLVMKFDLVNVWNLESDVIMTWEISNMFWFSKKISIDAWNITPGMTVPVEANLWSVPSYGWLFNIKLKSQATPYFSYDISNSDIDPTLLEPKEFVIKTTYFQMPRMMIWAAIVIIFLLFIALRKPKQKIVYVEKK